MARGMRNPQTPAEWQQAANLARACLLIDSARKYGLITGGPEIMLWRCDVILTRAASRGIRPQEEVALQMAVELGQGGNRP